MTQDSSSDFSQLTANDISAFVHGDVGLGRKLSALEYQALKEFGAFGEPYQLRLSDLMHVLTAFRAGIFAAAEVKQWAEFVWQGDFSLSREVGPFDSLEIEWEPQHSELIAELLDPLHRLGDPGQDRLSRKDLGLMLLQAGEAMKAN